MKHRRGAVIYAQGDPCDSVHYIQNGGVKLSVVSTAGREAVVAMLGPGDLFGEGGLAGQGVRTASATALTPTTALVIGEAEMVRALHAEHALSDRFITFMLSRNIRIEEDLLDQIFNSVEQRLARAVLRRARYGAHDGPERLVPAASLMAPADTVGTNSSRVTQLLEKFIRLGFIEADPAGIAINSSLLSVVLHD